MSQTSKSMCLDLLLMIFYVCTIGAIVGSISGLVPGIHVNTLAALILVFNDTLESLISIIVPDDYAPVMLACMVVSAAVIHSATDFIPSLFFGVPDAENTLNIMPGQEMLLEGHGMVAIRCAAIGSLVGAFASIILSIPMYYLLSNGLGDYLDSLTIGILISVLALMIYREREGRRILGLALICGSGALGCVTMSMDLPFVNVFGMEPESMFPMLSGLFGIPALLISSPSGHIPPQEDDEILPIGPIPGLKGTVTGSIMGWYPGVTSSCGASVASSVFGEEDKRGYVSIISSIGTSATMFTFIALAVSGKERSGTMAVVNGILDGAPIRPFDDTFVAILITMAISSILAYLIMIQAGKIMCKVIEHVDISKMNAAVLTLMIVLTILFTGYWGLVLLLACTLLGLVPVVFDANRMHLTGCLIVPVLLFKLGLM